MYILVRCNTDQFIELSPDDADLATVRWVVNKTTGYVTGRYKKDLITLHRFVAERKIDGPIPEGLFVDHKDGNKLNCRRSNLRIVTRQQNLYNQKPHKNSRTGYKGVQTNGYNWYAAIMHDGKRKYYGPYLTPLEAARVYDEKAIEFYGEYARINGV